MKRIKIDEDFYINANSLEHKTKNRKESSGNRIGKRFYTALDMAIIKMDQAKRNAKIKRGEAKRFGNEYICVCGCGTEGCFIHSGYESVSKEKMNEFEKENYRLRNNIVKPKKESEASKAWRKLMEKYNKEKIESLGFDYKTSFRTSKKDEKNTSNQ